MFYTYKISNIRVIDGDTIEATIHLGFNIDMRRKIRLSNVDTWELRGPNKAKGKAAKLFLKELLEENPYTILISNKDKSGKYGRILGNIWASNTVDNFGYNVNLMMREDWSKETKE